MQFTFEIYRAGQRKSTGTDPNLRQELQELGCGSVSMLFAAGYELQVCNEITRSRETFTDAALFEEFWSQVELAASLRLDAEACREPLPTPDLSWSVAFPTEASVPKTAKAPKHHTSVRSAVNPQHHAGFVDDYGWLDVECRKPHFRTDPEGFIKAVRLQVDKYMGRNGRKDDELQEFKKAAFYLQYIIMFIENGRKPILAIDVHKRLGTD